MTRFITDYLVQEHQELSLLLNDLQQQLGTLGFARDRRKAAERLTGIQRQIAEALQSHVEEEEQILYPAIQKRVEGIGFTLERMRQEHDSGEQTEKTFHQSLNRLLQGTGSPREVIQNGRKYITWLRHHLMEESGRLFPMVERGLDSETQQAVRRALEDLSQGTPARVAESQANTARA